MMIIGIAVARLRNLFAVVMLSGIFSLTAAVLYVVMDAVDVAFTEAAVGAGISTVLMLGTLALTTSEEKPELPGGHPWAFLLVLITGISLVYGTLDMPFYGDPTSAIHNHVAPYYLEKSFGHTGLPNVVTSVLASYRGFDTLGEIFVIFTAATAILLTLGHASFGQRRKAQLKSGNLRDPMRHNVILRVVSKLLIPVILMFALYVQWHGDFGPGGGFQAGTIFGACIYFICSNIRHRYCTCNCITKNNSVWPCNWGFIIFFSRRYLYVYGGCFLGFFSPCIHSIKRTALRYIASRAWSWNYCKFCNGFYFLYFCTSKKLNHGIH